MTLLGAIRALITASSQGDPATTEAESGTTELCKDPYVVVHKRDFDTPATTDCTKSTAESDDIRPSTDVHAQSIWWTVEPAPSQAAKQESHDRFASAVRAVRLEMDAIRRTEPPRSIQPAATASLVNLPLVSGPAKYVIRPIDGYDLDQCKITGASLKALLGDDLRDALKMNGKFMGWKALLDIYQVKQVEGIDGVGSVYRVH